MNAEKNRKIADWLDVKKSSLWPWSLLGEDLQYIHYDGIVRVKHVHNEDEFIEWISSSEGEAAMMAKLEEEEFAFQIQKDVCDKHVSIWMARAKQHSFGRSLTRNEALQAAIWEVIK